MEQEICDRYKRPVRPWGATAEITSDPLRITTADHVILPGVGAFGDCMQSLNATRLTETVRQVAQSGVPFLGICLGMQLLFEESEESPGAKGLGVFAGKIKRIPKQEGYKIPHMGWNSLHLTGDSPLLQNLPEEPFVYFVHSYYACPQESSIIAATTTYCGELPVALSHGNIFATQFHPEKSGEVGLKILQNFIQQGGTA